MARADARRLPLADGVVHCCVTSPPYWGLRDYGVAGQLGLEPTPDAYVAGMVEVFREVRRVLRDDGTAWVNLGDSYARIGGEQGGGNRELMHLAGVQRRMTALPDGAGLKPKDLVGMPWRVAFALQADGWWLRSDIIWSKPNPMPESVTDRPTKAHEYVFLLAKSERYAYDADAIKEPAVYGELLPSFRGSGNYTHDQAFNNSKGPKASTAGVKLIAVANRNRRTVWTVATEPCADAHFAMMPTALVKPCILAGAPLGGLVLDPFLGSGTVGRVAEDLGRRWVGFDLSADYLAIASKRTAQLGLFTRAS